MQPRELEAVRGGSPYKPAVLNGSPFAPMTPVTVVYTTPGPWVASSPPPATVPESLF